MDSTSKIKIGTLYDSVFRTMLNDCTQLIIPVVNEAFNESYTGNEEIILEQNEIFLRQQDNISEKITDTSFAIIVGDEPRHYHLECQSNDDNSMVVRMYEYDSQLAMRESRLEDGVLHVSFPHSAVLYLRHGKNTPDSLRIFIHTMGGTVSYDVPTLKVQMYTIKEIFDKKLLFLIPFYIFTYESRFGEIDSDADKLRQLRETYSGIVQQLDGLCMAGEIDEYTMKTICELSQMVLDGIAKRYENVKSEVNSVMGGQVLDYEAKRILNKGMEQGVQRGIKQGREEERRISEVKIAQGKAKIASLVLQLYNIGVSVDAIAESAGLDIEETWEIIRQAPVNEQ